jgi:hypothetical protein
LPPLMKSNSARIYVELDGETVLYEVALNSPCSDLFLDRVDLREQAKRDRLSLPAIKTRLRGWMRSEPNAEKVAVTYGAGNYTVGILAKPLTRTIMTCLQVSFEKVLDVFGPCDPLVWVVGSKQRDAAMLYSPPCSVARFD